MPRSCRTNEEVPDIAPVSAVPFSNSGEVEMEDDDSPLTVEALLPRHPHFRNDFNKDQPLYSEPSTSGDGPDSPRRYPYKYGIPAHVEGDYVDIHRPGYCAFYE